MTDVNELLQAARDRAREAGVPYDGLALPKEAAAVLQANPAARLVDVRSRAEWDFVGRVPKAVEIEWKTYPGMRPNPEFTATLEAKIPKDAPVFFLCRSGGRSHDTAIVAKQLGYLDVYNVLEGMEGDRDGTGHRNTVGGWKASGLPWTQS